MRDGDRVREKAIAKWAYQQGNFAYVMESNVCFRCFRVVEMQRNDPRCCCSLVINRSHMTKTKCMRSDYKYKHARKCGGKNRQSIERIAKISNIFFSFSLSFFIMTAHRPSYEPWYLAHSQDSYKRKHLINLCALINFSVTYNAYIIFFLSNDRIIFHL